MAQEPGSYKVLRYVYATMKRRETREVLLLAARPAVLKRSCADVSFLAGMLVEKFVWHQPLHRQHKRLEASGIHVSRGSLTNWTRRSIDLLQPVFEAQCGSVLSSAAIAMDETSIRAGRDRLGHMRRGFLRPIYGDRESCSIARGPALTVMRGRVPLGAVPRSPSCARVPGRFRGHPAERRLWRLRSLREGAGGVCHPCSMLEPCTQGV